MYVQVGLEEREKKKKEKKKEKGSVQGFEILCSGWVKYVT